MQPIQEVSQDQVTMETRTLVRKNDVLDREDLGERVQHWFWSQFAHWFRNEFSKPTDEPLDKQKVDDSGKQEVDDLDKHEVKVPDESSAIWKGVAKIEVVVSAILGFFCLMAVPLWVESSLAIPAGLGLLGLCFLGYAVYSIDIKPVSNPDKT
jgi:hypothetical protein